MLGLFRTTDPYRLIWLSLFVLAACMPWFFHWPGVTYPELRALMTGIKVREGFFLYSQIIDTTPPLAAWFYGLCEWVMGQSLTVRHIVAWVIFFLSGAYYSLLLIFKRAFPENTLVPALVFGTLGLVSFDMLALTAELPAFVLLLFALKLLMDEIEFREQKDDTILKLGLCTGLASLCVFSYLVFLPGIIVFLLVFTRISLRRLLLLLFGFCLPHGLLIGYFFYHGRLSPLTECFYLANAILPRRVLMDTTSLLWLLVVPGAFLLLSFFVLNRNARLTKYQSQLLQVTLLWLLLSLVHYALARETRPQTFLPAIPALSFILSHHFLLIKKKFAEFHLWLFILGIISTSYLSQYEILPVDYDKLVVRNEPAKFSSMRVLDLTGNNSLYLQNTPAPPVLDMHLAKKILSAPDVIESVILINHLFTIDPPDRVIDPENQLAPFMQRIPALSLQYSRQGTDWVRAVNN